MSKWKQIVRERLAVLRLPPPRESDIVEELALHLEAAFEEARAEGLSAAEAEVRVVNSFDWHLLECELSRTEPSFAVRSLPAEFIERRGGIRMESLLHDLRFGARMLFKQPGFTLVAVITLALGIGANTAIFSVVNAVLLRPLSFAESDRIVAIGSTYPANRNAFGSLSYPDFVDFQTQNAAFERMAMYSVRGFQMTDESGGVRFPGAIVGAELFPVLGTSPWLGRTFKPDEDKAGGGRVVVLSHHTWQNRFQADAQIIGRGISLNGQSYTVVGVMPPGFQFPIQTEPVEMWANFAVDREGAMSPSAQRGNHYLEAVGRLKPGVTVAQAEAQLVSLAARLEQLYPSDNRGYSVKAASLLNRLTGDIRDSLRVVWAAVGCVLLIACANVANLLLARAVNRRREIAVRLALGAGRWRVMRQLLTESLLLVLLGGSLGLVLAAIGTEALVAITPDNIPRIAEVSVDGRVLWFTLLTATATGLLMGLVPAWQATQADLHSVLKEGGRNLGGVRATVRNVLVIAEVALAVILLAGAGLLLNSFARLLRVNPGFNADRLLTMKVGLPRGTYAKAADSAAFYDRLLNQLEGLPGVTAYSTVAPLPLTNSNLNVGFGIEGRLNHTGRNFPHDTRLAVVGAGYFAALGVALKQGREYTTRDSLYAPPVTLINETFAKTFFPNENPLGKRINPAINADDRPLPMREIVGVVADIKTRNLSAAVEPEVYLHYPQCPALGSFSLVLRTEQDPQGLTNVLRDKINRLDRTVSLGSALSLDSYVAETVAQPRFNGLLTGLFALLALSLTALGLYGVISYTVAQRTPEIGLRLALGAQTRDVLQYVLGQGMKLVFIGAAIGLAGAFAVARTLKSMLFGVSPADPLTFTAVPLFLTFVALAACWIPARRATKVDPLIALRHE
jgi:putative ABC transport system permease protein